MDSFLGIFENLRGWILLRSCGEIFIIYVILYTILRVMQGTRGAGILRGLAFTLVIVTIVILFIIKKLEFYTVNWLITEFLPVLIIPIIILFQPEFRRALIRLGHSPYFRIFVKSEVKVNKEIIKAVTSLSGNKIGGLITIEREDGLNHYVESGTRIDSNISSDLISTIFWPGTPLHDGAVIVQELKIAAAGCLFPLTDSEDISKTCGTRHRAGIGITEETDSISIIVSEETGLISVAVGGKLKENVTPDELRKALEGISNINVKEKRSR
ncbi:MAG: TIGR00159 family protein [Candidatus Brocadiaceae bacterium]|nr:TIGR00159 family protein [Candidatus Brocadiaceae bacterium]